MIRYIPVESSMKSTASLPADMAFSPTKNQLRYAQWQSMADMNGLYPVEFLLPQLRREIEIAEFPFMSLECVLPRSEIEAKIESLAPWAYYFKLLDLETSRHGNFSSETVLFHRYRSWLISDTVARLFGDERQHARALDMACHCGAFTIDLATRGFEHLSGVDLREENIAQAKFISEAFNVRNVDFSLSNVYDLPDEPYDVCLCLGLLYHLTDPYRVIEYLKRNSKRFAVIDTICHREPFSALHVVCDKDVRVSIEGDASMELHPTYRALIDMVKEAGFEFVVEVTGETNQWIDLYSDYVRRCIICFNKDGMPLLENIKDYVPDEPINRGTEQQETHRDEKADNVEALRRNLQTLDRDHLEDLTLSLSRRVEELSSKLDSVSEKATVTKREMFEQLKQKDDLLLRTKSFMAKLMDQKK